MMITYNKLANRDWSCLKGLGVDRPHSSFTHDLEESRDRVVELITDHLAALNSIGEQIIAERKDGTLDDTNYQSLSGWHHDEQDGLQRRWDRFSKRYNRITNSPSIC